MNEYYIYIYFDPNNIPFYVGKGKGYRYAIRRHLCKDNTNTFLNNKIRKVGIDNVKTQFPYKDLTEEQAFYLEEYYIAGYGRKDLKLGTLCNLTNGGGGMSGNVPSMAVKKKISDTLKGHKVSAETSQKIREKAIGRPSPNKRKVLSIEEREKISKGLKGNIPWNKGKKMSVEYCRINSESHKGKKLSEDHKRKIGDSHRGMKYKKNKKSKSGDKELWLS